MDGWHPPPTENNTYNPTHPCFHLAEDARVFAMCFWSGTNLADPSMKTHSSLNFFLIYRKWSCWTSPVARAVPRLAKPSFKLRSHWLTRYQGHNYSPSMSPRVNSSPSSAKVGSMLSMVEMYSPVSIVSFRPSAPRLSPQGRGRGENTQDRWAVLWRSATPTTPATNREDNSCSQRPWDKADASREADDDVDKPVHADVRLSRRHLVLRWLRHSQTDSEAEGGRSLVEAKLLLSWDQSSSSNERVAFAVVW